MQNIIIVKSESDNSDIYSKVLKNNNFNPIFIPSLDFAFKNISILREKVLNPDKYSGIIFVSPRCVNAVKIAINDDILEWNNLDNYCVGETTHQLAAKELNLICKGKNSGNASNLADFINFDFTNPRTKYPFLLPCGNLKLNILETKFLEFGYKLDEIEVYDTIPHADLEKNLVKFISNESLDIIVFFSPSGVNYCYDIINKLEINLKNKKLVAIGPTTKKCMESKGWSVYRTAEKPTPDHLVSALTNIE